MNSKTEKGVMCREGRVVGGASTNRLLGGSGERFRAAPERGLFAREDANE